MLSLGYYGISGILPVRCESKLKTFSVLSLGGRLSEEGRNDRTFLKIDTVGLWWKVVFTEQLRNETIHVEEKE